MWGVYIGQGHLTTAARELAKYKLDVRALRKLGGTKQALLEHGDYIFSVEK